MKMRTFLMKVFKKEAIFWSQCFEDRK